MSEFEKVKQGKEGIEFKIEKFDKASKHLDKLLESQITDKSKKDLGYSVVPPPHPLIYNRPKKLDLSYSSLDEFKEPEFKGYGSKVKQVSKDSSSFVESSLNVDKETIFPVDKKVESIKPKNHENPVKKSVRYAEMFRSQTPMGESKELEWAEVQCKYDQKERMEKAVNTARPQEVNTAGPNTVVVNAVRGKPQQDDTGFVNNGWSRHMTGNIAYLSNFKEFDGGYVTFGGGAHGDNGTEFKNKFIVDFCREKADSQLPTIFWAEAVSISCCVHNRVLVVKPHNKTPYEIFRGFKPALSFMKPFRCHVTILNTLASLGKFDGKSDEGFFVGYSLSSKAFRVYNTRTRRVEENLHIRFLENKPIIEGNGPKLLFDIDSLTQSMNYVPVTAGTIINESAGTQEELNVGTSEEMSQDCIVMPIWKDASYLDSPTQDVDNGEPKSAADDQKQDGDGPDNENDEQDKSDDVSSPKEVNAAGQHVNTTSPDVNTGSFKLNTVDPSVNTASSYDQDSPKDMFTIGASHTLEATHVEFFSDEDELEVDLGNITNSYTVPTTPNTRIHKDHPIENVIGDVKSSVQTRRMIKPTSKQGFLSAVYEQKTHDTLNTCLYACFLSQIEPTSIAKALSDSSWVEAMQEELLQFKLQQVWILVDLPIGKRAIGTKWVFRNKKDERGIVIRNKARIEAIRLFLAYASFMGFLVYQMDVKSAFLYGTIDEEVYVTQPPGFKDPDHPDKVYKVVKAVYGLHQAPRACQNKYVAEILKKFNYSDVKFCYNSIDLGKTFGSRMVDDDDVCACARFQVTPKTSHLLAVKRIFRYLKGKPTLAFGFLRYPQSVVPLKKVGDEAVHKELGDRMERAATTASSLEAEQDSGSVLPYPKFAEMHNVVAFLEKPEESDGFAEIIDFLKASSVSYALTVNPVIYTSCIEQFWATAKVQTVNGVRQLQALVDKKRVIVTESSIRRDLHLDDAEGTDCLPTATIFEELALDQKPSVRFFPTPKKDKPSKKAQRQEAEVLDLQKAKDAQAKEIAALKKRIQRGGSIEDIDADVDVSLVDESQERQNDDLMFDCGVLEDDVMHVEAKVDGKDKQSKKPDDSTAGEAVTTASIDDSTAGEAVTTAGIDDSAVPTTNEEITLAQTLIQIRS
ncbi:putative ribonuclease H-like domain-containing protein [Tanacetum coccineum]